MSVGMVVRMTFSCALVALAVALVATDLLTMVGWTLSRAESAAGVIAAASSGALVWFSSWHDRAMRGAAVLAFRLREPGAAPEAFEALDRLLTRLEDRQRRNIANVDHEAGDNRSEYAEILLRVVGPLCRAGFWGSVRQRLARLQATDLTAPLRALWTQNLATCLLRDGEIEAVQRLLQEQPRPASDPSAESWMSATEALVMAITDQPKLALVRANQATATKGTADHQGNLEESLRATYRMVRAHAHASLGNISAARTELERLAQEAGEEALVAMAIPVGPATAIAEQVTKESQSG